MFSVYVLALSTTRYVNNFSKARLKCCTAMLQISFLSEKLNFSFRSNHTV